MLSSIIYFEENCTEIFEKLEFIYCADAGPGSYNIRKFNDCGYKLLSNDKTIRTELDRLQLINLLQKPCAQT